MPSKVYTVNKTLGNFNLKIQNKPKIQIKNYSTLSQ